MKRLHFLNDRSFGRLCRFGMGLAALAFCIAAGEKEAGLADPPPPYADIAMSFADKLPTLHLEPVAFDDTIAERALSLFLSSLDGDHSIFLASDIAKFKTREHSLDDMMKNGDVGFAREVVDVFRARVEERCQYVEKLLSGPLSTTNNEVYVWNRRTALWPADLREQDELWRKKITDQYIRRILGAEFAGKREEAGKTGQVVSTVGKTNDIGKAPSHEEFIIRQYRQFQTVLRDNDDEWIFQQYMSAFARAYDPHSDFMSASTAEDFDINMKLSLVGIGARLSSEDGAAKVVEVIRGGAADRDGRLKPGDRIIGVAQGDGDMVDVLHWPLNKTVRLIRGPKGTKVVLTVIPASDPTGATTAKINIVRDDVKLEDQEAKGTVKEVKGKAGVVGRLGIVTLPSFYADLKRRSTGTDEYKSSARDVYAILKKMESDSVRGILLDLRSNGGGSLTEAVEMTGLFIKLGPVVQVKDRRGVVVLEDQDPETVYGGPLVVLVDRMSASASEILAGALQDYGRAVIVGDSRTHGKGTVQCVVPVRNGKDSMGSIKVTNAGFYRFTGNSTQIKGISADIVLSSPFDGMEVGEDHLEYALPWSKIRPVDLGRRSSGGFIDLLFWRTPRSESDYEKAADIRRTVETLRKLSEKRRQNDERYVAREKLLQSFAARMKNETIPLDLPRRREQAAEEVRLDDLQRISMLDGGADETDVKKDSAAKDLVLEEGLNILSDLADLQAEGDRR